jgi:hypothetical protein
MIEHHAVLSATTRFTLPFFSSDGNGARTGDAANAAQQDALLWTVLPHPLRRAAFRQPFRHGYPGIRPRIGGVTASTPQRACTNALAWVHESTASLHACRGVRARVPGHRCTNRWRHCIHATACLHACPGLHARIGGVTASTPRRACTNTLAWVHEPTASLHLRHGVHARIPWRGSTNARRACNDARRSRRNAASRVAEKTRASIALRTFFKKSTGAMAKTPFSRPPI